ncbi:MAG: SBBP repeat-containing protein [Bryobacteraceae bacterium]
MNSVGKRHRLPQAASIAVVAIASLVLVSGSLSPEEKKCLEILCQPADVFANIFAVWFTGVDCSATSSSSGSSTPFSLEANIGQADPRYGYLARGPGYYLFLDGPEAVFDARNADGTSVGVIRMSLDGHKTPESRVEPLDYVGPIHYLHGSDPSRWLTGVPRYAALRYHDVYPGVDLVYYQSAQADGRGPGPGKKLGDSTAPGESVVRESLRRSGELEHDFLLAPGADPSSIRIRFEGADSVRSSGDDLEIAVGGEVLVWRKPVLYQERAGARAPVTGAYRLAEDGSVGFEVGSYDPSRPLVIDPVVSYSTFIGRSGADMVTRAAVDSGGNAYLTGATNDVGFPTTPGAPVRPPGAAQPTDAFVTKFDAAGSRMVYSTRIGGSDGDTGTSIAVDAQGNVYVAGSTESKDFPTTSGVVQGQFAPPGDTSGDRWQCFVAKLNPAGTQLAYATYLGGSRRDACSGLAVDASGNAYLTGITESTNFPRSENAPQQVNRGDGDAFITKLNPTATSIVYSTLFGGTGRDLPTAIAVDSASNAYIAGGTASSLGFPATAGALQTQYGGARIGVGDAFVAKLDPTGSRLLYATYLGGLRDEAATSLAVDAAGNAYITGSTDSANFPVTAGALQPTPRIGAPGELANETFVAKLNPAGNSLVYATYLGGTKNDVATAIAVDSAGRAAIAGFTTSTDLPVTQDATQRANAGFEDVGLFQTGDAFVAQLNPQGSALEFATYLGGAASDWALGLAFDTAGSMYVAGGTASRDFPTTAGVFQPGYGGGPDIAQPLGDGFVVKLGGLSAGGQVSIASVGSAASYAAGSVAPGEIVVLQGVGIGPANLAVAAPASSGFPTTFSDTRVLFDGVAAPMLYASGAQSSCIVPYGVAGKQTVQVVLEYRGTRSAPVTVQVVAAKPALFSANSSGRGPGAILNQDYSVNSAVNPAEQGSYVQLYGTGEGETDPPGVDGRLANGVFPKPKLPVSVTIGGRAAEIAYAGAAPGAVAGLMQINAKAPQGASGNLEVIVTIGGARSQTGLTVAVK